MKRETIIPMAHASIASRFNKAVSLEKDRKYGQALKEYIGIINDCPTYRRAYINIGSLFSRMNRLNDAMKCYLAALSLGEDYITHFNMGCLYYKSGMYENAVTSLLKAFGLNNHFHLTMLVLGLCYSRLNRLDDAEKSFKRVLRRWPHNRVAMTALSFIYFNRGMYEHSLYYVDQILRHATTKGNAAMQALKADILLKMGRYEESASEIKSIKKVVDGYKMFDEFIQSVPVDSLSDRYGTIDEKIHKLKRASKVDPTQLISLSLCHLFKGDTDEAIDCLFKLRKKY